MERHIGVRADGQRVRALRHKLGLTQMELSDNAGISKRTLEKIEQGSTVRSATIKRLSDCLGVSIHDVVASGGSEEIAPFVRQTAIAATDAWITNVLAINVRLEAVSEEMTTDVSADHAYFARRLRGVLQQVGAYYPTAWHESVKNVNGWREVSSELRATIDAIGSMADELSHSEVNVSLQEFGDELMEHARNLWQATEKLLDAAERELNIRFDSGHRLRGPHFRLTRSDAESQ